MATGSSNNPPLGRNDIGAEDAAEGKEEEVLEHKREGGYDGSEEPQVPEGGLDIIVPRKNLFRREGDPEVPDPDKIIGEDRSDITRRLVVLVRDVVDSGAPGLRTEGAVKDEPGFPFAFDQSQWAEVKVRDKVSTPRRKVQEVAVALVLGQGLPHQGFIVGDRRMVAVVSVGSEVGL